MERTGFGMVFVWERIRQRRRIPGNRDFLCGHWELGCNLGTGTFESPLGNFNVQASLGATDLFPTHVDQLSTSFILLFSLLKDLTLFFANY